jgi:hypothetical protein
VTGVRSGGRRKLTALLPLFMTVMRSPAPSVTLRERTAPRKSARGGVRRAANILGERPQHVENVQLVSYARHRIRYYVHIVRWSIMVPKL